MLMYLAETPFGRTGGASAIQLENESESVFNSNVLLTDGEIPLRENISHIFLEGDEDLDHIVLDGTDGSGTDQNDNILMEDGSRVLNEDQGFVTRGSKDRVLLERGCLLLAECDFYSFPVGFSVNIGERILSYSSAKEQDSKSI